VVDQFSPAETPRAGSVFTHKLDFEWDTAFHLFNRLPEGSWLRNVEAEISLDYLATGLPRAGDLTGGARFLAFGVDPDFCNSVDGLVELDLHRLRPHKRRRYLGKTDA